METIRNASPGRWVLTADHTTNMLRTDQYDKNILTEDEELLGIRFRQPQGFAFQGFEVNLFIDKQGDLDEKPLPLVSKMIQLGRN